MEAFVVDDEMLSHVYRMLRGIEVSEASLGFDAIEAVVDGDGHFLGAGHTMDAMQRDYFYPSLSDRNSPNARRESGGEDIRQRARATVRDVLDRHLAGRSVVEPEDVQLVAELPHVDRVVMPGRVLEQCLGVGRVPGAIHLPGTWTGVERERKPYAGALHEPGSGVHNA